MNTSTNRGARELSAWLDYTGQSAAAFAQINNLSPRLVQMYAAGTAVPKIKAAVVIEKATAGKVGVKAWVEDGGEG